MSTVVQAMRTIASAWEAITPASGGRTYHHIDDRESDDSWSVSDRGFMWDLPQFSSVAAETAGAAKPLLEWAATATVFVARDGRGYFDYAADIAAVSAELTLAVMRQNIWPAGVAEVLVESTEVEDGDDGAAIALNFTVLCSEA